MDSCFGPLRRHEHGAEDGPSNSGSVCHVNLCRKKWLKVIQLPIRMPCENDGCAVPNHSYHIFNVELPLKEVCKKPSVTSVGWSILSWPKELFRVGWYLPRWYGCVMTSTIPSSNWSRMMASCSLRFLRFFASPRTRDLSLLINSSQLVVNVDCVISRPALLSHAFVSLNSRKDFSSRCLEVLVKKNHEKNVTFNEEKCKLNKEGVGLLSQVMKYPPTHSMYWASVQKPRDTIVGRHCCASRMQRMQPELGRVNPNAFQAPPKSLSYSAVTDRLDGRN